MGESRQSRHIHSLAQIPHDLPSLLQLPPQIFGAKPVERRQVDAPLVICGHDRLPDLAVLPGMEKDQIPAGTIVVPGFFTNDLRVPENRRQAVPPHTRG